jgi:hypothetical protein
VGAEGGGGAKGDFFPMSRCDCAAGGASMNFYYLSGPTIYSSVNRRMYVT